MPRRAHHLVEDVLQHAYHGIAAQILWNVVIDELPKLKAAMLAIRATAQDT